jgi:hypothetical protein
MHQDKFKFWQLVTGVAVGTILGRIVGSIIYRLTGF